jgi:quercetin dioxygenase-like cupin family protein
MSEAVARSTRDDAGKLLILDTEQVDAIPWEPLRDLDGVYHKVLWRSGDAVIGLMRVTAGKSEPRHVHFHAHHHIWVVAGSGTIAGRAVSGGSYAYIPPGVEHGISDVGPSGCTVFYSYRPVRSPQSEVEAAVAPV